MPWLPQRRPHQVQCVQERRVFGRACKKLGYWSSSDERPPQLVYDNVRLAINYQLLYPRWLFLWDFPPSQLQNLARRAGPAFVKSAQDFVVPRARMAVGENKQSDGVCALL